MKLIKCNRCVRFVCYRCVRRTDLEAVKEKEAVTPGEVVAAGELLGDLLFEMKAYDEAVSAYTRVLERSPNRFYSLSGIGKAAEAAGDTATAKRYYQLLVELGKDADQGLTRLDHARSFLESS
jgi:tetratricopeptide (TPR) repeat protein